MNKKCYHSVIPKYLGPDIKELNENDNVSTVRQTEHVKNNKNENCWIPYNVETTHV